MDLETGATACVATFTGAVSATIPCGGSGFLLGGISEIEFSDSSPTVGTDTYKFIGDSERKSVRFRCCQGSHSSW